MRKDRRNMSQKWKVGILLFNQVEVLDFAGPFEVFSVTTGKQLTDKPFFVYTVAQTKNPIHARNGLTVVPDYDFKNAPDFDILIIPGGYGAEEVEINNQTVLEWIRKSAKKASLTASVCTGAFLLAKAGLLNGKSATTHWMDMDRLKKEFPEIRVLEGKKYVDEEGILTSGGISAGIDMSLHIVGKLLGRETSEATAKRMEYMERGNEI
jgi:transcriptional regulator GlxA family with amidase domain